MPVSSWVAAGMKAGVTAARRARNRPPKSVKYSEAFSSITFNLAPPLPERTHVEDEMPKFWTVHKPFPSGINDPAHLFVVPLRNLIRDKEGLVVSEEFW